MNNSKYVLFLFLVLFKIYVISANENEAEYKKAINLSEVVKTESRFVEKIDAINAVDYPIGLVAEGKGIEYSIIIDKDEINEKGSFLSAYMVFVIPQSGDTLGFAAHMIPLDADGGITGDVKLSLIKPISFKLGSDILITILGGNDGSYALFGCNGFKSMTISANIDFSSETFLCEDTKTGEPILGKKLTTNFKTTIEDWNNMIISVSLPPFQIKGIEGFGFEASNITFDLSDYSNPAGAVLPLKYSEKLPGGNLNLWQGFYLKDLIIRFPPAFSKSDNNSNGNNSVRTSIFASNLIIDDEGFSGTIGADGVLKIEEGSMSGWNFSIDRFDMTFEMSSITSSSFRGKMKIPMLDSLLLYRAVIGMDGNFSFTITTTTKQSFSLWAADLELTNSQITIDYINKKFKPKAILNGKLNISADLSGSKKSNDGEKSLSLAEIKFENLELQTETPYIKGGYFSLGSEKAT